MFFFSFVLTVTDLLYLFFFFFLITDLLYTLTKMMNSSEGEKKTNRKDPAWKYGIEAPLPPNSKRTYCYITCKFCNKVIKGGVRRLKDHLGGTRRNAAPCPNVPKEVKDGMIVYMKSFNDKKHASQKMFDERVNSTSYFGAPTAATEDVNSCPSYSVSGP